ncbi:MAG: tetratricopeptide repeat protein, partial [Moorea sp. SIO3E2]|nr:tetratricopeptide repeat protein [Moorena sp. SIO3E2]
DPAGYAATQNNLGTAYWHLADQLKEEYGAKAEYFKQCITAYENALAIAGYQPHPSDQVSNHNRSPVPVNFDIIATYNNLGLVNFQLATHPQFSLSKGSKLTHLEAALHQHVQACMGTVEQPETYQISLNYLIHTIRAFSRENGPAGQSFALSKVPGQLLPEILHRL